MHYNRVPPFYWKDRLSKMYAAGLNAVQTYVFWNFHESSPGEYNFEGDHDVVRFIQTAQEVGLLVILRPGPYICSEWDMGGLPSWLLTHKGILLRSSDPTYLALVDKWLSVLLPKMKPLLYENGGPIITVQVENEYGNYQLTCDHSYIEHLADTFRKYLGPNVVLFTTDASSYDAIKCGSLPSLYATVDFGLEHTVDEAFKVQRIFEPKGPLVNSEMYTGWLDFWGRPHEIRITSQVVHMLDEILKHNASVNMYMFEGGTNFGFWNGADSQPNYLSNPTSYDYNAPLSEAGDPTDKYVAIRELLSKYTHVPSDVLPATSKAAYGKVMMHSTGNVFDSIRSAPAQTSEQPLSFETLGHSFGFVVYTATVSIPANTPFCLIFDDLRDRASVYLSEKYSTPWYAGVLMRQYQEPHNLTTCITGQEKQIDQLQILVENMGRIAAGPLINDSKGILNGVYYSDNSTLPTPIKGWTSQPVPLNNSNLWDLHPLNKEQAVPITAAFFAGDFTIQGTPKDTFLNVSNWSKGVAFINGFNLGRYWPVKGPQKTLYVPANVLVSAPDANKLFLFEIDSAPCQPPFDECFATFVDTPDIG